MGTVKLLYSFGVKQAGKRVCVCVRACVRAFERAFERLCIFISCSSFILLNETLLRVMSTPSVNALVTREATETPSNTYNQGGIELAGQNIECEAICHLRVLLVNGEAFQVRLPVSNTVTELKRQILAERPKRKVTVASQEYISVMNLLSCTTH